MSSLWNHLSSSNCNFNSNICILGHVYPIYVTNTLQKSRADCEDANPTAEASLTLNLTEEQSNPTNETNRLNPSSSSSVERNVENCVEKTSLTPFDACERTTNDSMPLRKSFEIIEHYFPLNSSQNPCHEKDEEKNTISPSQKSTDVVCPKVYAPSIVQSCQSQGCPSQSCSKSISNETCANQEKRSMLSNMHAFFFKTVKSKNDTEPKSLLPNDNNDIMIRHILSDVHTRLYITYRKQIPNHELIGAKYASDAGWGCLIRSGQMLFAEALQRLYLGRVWRKDFVSESTLNEYSRIFDSPYHFNHWSGRAEEIPYREYMDQLFSSTNRSLNTNENSGDDSQAREVSEQTPSRKEKSSQILQFNQIAIYHHIIRQFYDSWNAPFSIQNICDLAERKYGLPVGKWFSPTIIANSLKDLHESNPVNSSLAGVYVCENGTIYLDEIESKFSVKDTLTNFAFESNEDAIGGILKLDQTNDMKPFVLLLPTKLGIDRSNPIYEECMRKALHCPYSVGIAGGKRHHSLYFFGFDDSGFLYFDPHVTREVSLDPQSYTFPSEKKLQSIKYQSIDPSMVMGFLIRTRSEWNDFLSYARKHFCPLEGKIDSNGSSSISSDTQVNRASILTIMNTRPTFDIREEEIEDEWNMVNV